MTKFRLILILFLFFFSLVKAEKKQEFNTINVDTRIIAPLIADIDVKDIRVEKSKKFYWVKFTEDELEFQKQNLIKLKCYEIGADTLVDVKFIIHTNKIGVTELIISGYPAKYRNFRSMTQEEIDYFIKGNKLNSGQIIIFLE